MIHFLQNQKKYTKYFLVALIILIALYGYRCVLQKVCGNSHIDAVVRKEVTITLPRGTVVAEVADTKHSRELGLSGRIGIADDKGMLFVFDQSGKYGFWMKDMNFAIDIIWITSDGIVVHIEKNIAPDSYPKTFINDVDALYVLELHSGSTEKYDLFLGAKVRIAN
jgi:uncharacterized membrane protein (UPF0127 family)